MSYSLPDLMQEARTASGAFGKTAHLPADNPERAKAHRENLTARLAYQVAKIIDGAGAEFTEADQRHICDVLASRVTGDGAA